MNWNPVLNKFIEIKNTYIKKFGNITYDYVKGHSDESGVAHYYQHHCVGAYYMLCQRMGLERCFLINYHMIPFGWDTEKNCKKWRRIFGEEKVQLLEDFHRCDLEAR